MRLEGGVSPWERGRGADSAAAPPGCSSRLPHGLPRPTGRPLKPGGGFDLGSTPLSWPRQMRWGRDWGADHPGLAFPAPSLPPPPPHTHPDCFRLLRGQSTLPSPTPCSCSPAARPHPKDSWERGWGLGAGSGAQLLGPGWDAEGRDMKELGRRGWRTEETPRRSPPRGLRTSGPQQPTSIGGVGKRPS